MKELNNNGVLTERVNGRTIKLILPMSSFIHEYGVDNYNQRMIELTGVVCPFVLAYTLIANFKISNTSDLQMVAYLLERNLLDELLDGLADKEVLIEFVLTLTHRIRPIINELLDDINWKMSDTYLLKVYDRTETRLGNLHVTFTLGTFA